MNKTIMLTIAFFACMEATPLLANNTSLTTSVATRRQVKKNIKTSNLALYIMLIDVRHTVKTSLQNILTQEEADKQAEKKLFSALRIIDQAIELLEDVVEGLNKQPLFANLEIEYRFINMCSFLADKPSVKPHHIRAFSDKVRQFNKYLTMYCVNRKDFIHPEEMKLFDSISKLNQLLRFCILREEYFDIDLLESLVDYTVYRALEVMADHPTITATVVTGLVVAGCYYGYQYITDKETLKKVLSPQSKYNLETPPTHASLKNSPTNNCYQNASTQVIAQIDPIVNHIKKNKEKYKDNPRVKQFITLIENLENSDCPIDPKDFSREFQKKYFSNDGLDKQQDAGEFIQHLLDELRLPDDILNIGLETKRTCKKCLKNSVAKEPMMSLQLSILQKDNPTIDDCLDNFFAEDTTSLTGENKLACSGQTCQDKQDAKQKSFITQQPEVVVIGLKRFEEKLEELSGKFFFDVEKINTPVQFPKEKLCLKKYLSSHCPGENCPPYNLTGIVYHSGQYPDSGHYVSTVKDKNNQEWYTYDDDYIKPCPDIDRVCQTGSSEEGTPYILFYEQDKTSSKSKE